MLSRPLLGYTIWGSLCILAACHKKTAEEPEPVRITFAPTSGAYNSLLTITGAGFRSTLTDNVVTINGVPAQVQRATANELVVKVPLGALSGPVTVQLPGVAPSTSAENFHYLYTTSVSSFPGQGYSGEATGIACDDQGTVYVANGGNNYVAAISFIGHVTVLAGRSGLKGHVDGPALDARFDHLSGLARDAQGNMYVSEWDSHDIRKITPAGVVSTLAGTGTQGYTDGPGAIAQFYIPAGLAVDGQGNVLVADQGNNRIRKITPAGVVSTVAGTGSSFSGGFADGPAREARFNSPRGVAVDAQGIIYVADANNNRIRKIALDGTVSTVAGATECGDADGPRSQARFYYPTGVAVDGRGMVYIADHNANRIRLLEPDGFVSTLAGRWYGCSGLYVPGSLTDGPGLDARFHGPLDLAVGPQGELYVADQNNYCVRRINLR